MGTKQCAGCGTQIASAARECPVCGRGSLMGELGMFAFLGVLLLGIGLASGLIPLSRPGPRPEAAPAKAAAPAPVLENPKVAQRRQSSLARRPRSGPQVQARAMLTGEPCPNPDTSAVERLLLQEPAADSTRRRAVACEAALGYGSASSDTVPPEHSVVNPSSNQATFFTAYDSIPR